MAASLTQWPKYLVESFEYASGTGKPTDESAYFPPYNSLLFYLFHPEAFFVVHPQFLIQENPDVFSPFIVKYNNHPVFFIEIRPPASFADASQRKQADEQMYSHFRNLLPKVVTPRLPAVSAFGTRLSFYEYTAANNTVLPPPIATDPLVLNDATSDSRWSCDLFEPDTVARFRQIVQDIHTMCLALGE